MTEAGNKIAVVTGAGTGVGRAASLALMKAGFTVVLAGRRLEKLEETKKLGDNVGNSLPVTADMTDPGSIAALFAKVMEVYGRLDVLFNNAGMGAPPVNFEDLSLEQWQGVVNTNLTGRSRRAPRGRSRRPIPRPSTPSPASPKPPTSTAACTISRSARSTSATP